MADRMIFAFLDHWRDTVVPILWSLFWAGALLGLSHRIEAAANAGAAGLDQSVKASIRKDLEAVLPERLGNYDSWAKSVPPSQKGDFKEQARSVAAYFRHDGGARFVLGSPAASKLILWSSGVKKRLKPGVLAVLFLAALVILQTAALIQRDQRLWRSGAYFASRLLVASACVRAILIVLMSFGDVWLTGSAAARLTSLPLPVSLWTVVLASPLLASALLDLLAVYCLSSFLAVICPDP